MLKFLIIFSVLFQIIDAGCKNGCLKYEKECFCLHSNPENFEIAKSNCLKSGGQLASIQKLKINEFIFQQSILNNLGKDLWINTTPKQISQRFFKLSQTTSEYANWSSNQKHVLQNPSKSCAAMSLSNGGFWFTESCTIPKPYICSFTIMESEAVDDSVTPTPQSPTEETTDGCIDQIASCQQYLNECSDPDYQPMLYKFCRKTCNLCSQCMDSDPQCPVWQSQGFCTNPVYQDKWNECAKTCKLC